jgi:hypothetical protein
MPNPWTEDWRKRVEGALDERGMASVLEYAKLHEDATFYELAEDLGGEYLAPVQIEILLREACEHSRCLDYYARSTLVRQLHLYVPEGIKKHGDWKLIRALSSWIAMTATSPASEEEFARVAGIIQHSEDLPADWLPQTADDPVLRRLFG